MEHYKNLSLEDLDNELWVFIDFCFSKSYMVSTLGRIKSIKDWNNSKVRILKQKKERDGYLRVHLSENGKSRSFSVHRLLMISFVPNPENKRTINHKNGIRHDNVISNLEWHTHSENLKHSFRELKRKPPMTGLGKSGELSHTSKKIICINNGVIYDSSRIASDKLGLSFQSICHILSGRTKKSRTGLIFKFI